MYTERLYDHTVSPFVFVYLDSMYIERLCLQKVSHVVHTYLQWRGNILCTQRDIMYIHSLLLYIYN